VPGWILASVLFGVVHSITPTYAVVAALVGAYLGWLWLWRDNLLAPIVTHAVYDFVALAYLTRRRAAAPNDAKEKQPQIHTDETDKKENAAQ